MTYNFTFTVTPSFPPFLFLSLRLHPYVYLVSGRESDPTTSPGGTDPYLTVSLNTTGFRHTTPDKQKLEGLYKKRE